VSGLRSLLSGDAAALKRLLIAGGVIAAVGILVIVTGVLEGWGQTRLFGAGFISVGGALGGVAIGFSEPMRGQVRARLNAWRVWIAVVTAIIIAAPAIVATLSGAAGPLVGGGDARDKLLVAIGALFGLLFAIVTIAAAVIAVQATQRRVGDTGQVEGDEKTGEERA
jgi:hypothetical protein